MGENKSPSWREYEADVAAFFTDLGLDVRLQQQVQGARAVHRVDVAVRHSSVGLPQLWIVECKDWARAVDKEKVLALAQIVLDVGADRGILLCEAGFQSGARDAASLTNITLASLDELRSGARSLIIDIDLRRLEMRLRDQIERLRALWKVEKRSPTSTVSRFHGKGVADISPTETLGRLCFVRDFIEEVRLARSRGAEFELAMVLPEGDWLTVVALDDWRAFRKRADWALDVLTADVSRLAGSD
jgi:hypothetical protein